MLVDLWQVSQVALVSKWVLVLPVAVVPLWQLMQLLETVTLTWNLAGSQVLVPLLWQVSQLADVVTWLAVLPLAIVPLWQLKQPLLTETLA